ncbi:hypothetical protein C6497_07710 [Candidatus Poribacteria bacterium]|nr:MAG: hypothetical protein C6497_07710 [Candidatus Poribacteria bacterium]
MENEKDSLTQLTSKDSAGTTVLFEMEYENEDSIAKSRGSGFFIESDKIVTNVHVLAGATKTTVRHVDTKRLYTIEGIVAFDDKNDLVILKIAEEDEPFSLGDSDTVRKRDKVYVVGYPNGNEIRVERTIHSIIYSRKRIMFDKVLSEGNSGGPVLNGKDEVIGVSAAVRISSQKNRQSKGTAISSKVLKLLLNEARQVESIDVWQKRPHIQAYTIADKGNEKREEGKYSEAIEHYNTALNLNPHLAEIYQNRAVVKMTLGKYHEAFTDRLTSIRLYPEQFSLNGFGAFLQQKWEIIKVYSLSLFMSVFCGVIGKENWLIIEAASKAGIGQVRAEQGNIPEARNLYQLAIDEITQAIRQKPKRSRSYNSRGWIRYLYGKFETEYGNPSKAQKLFKDAIVDADEALKLELIKEKLRSAYYHTRGAARDSLGEYSKAIEDFNESIRLNPKKALLFQYRGITKDALKQYEDALKDFQKAIELKPKESINYYHRGVTSNRIGHYNEAIDDLNNAIQLDEKNADAYYQRGFSNEMLGQHDMAETDYKQVLKINPNEPTKSHKLGLAKCKIRQYEQAIHYFDKSIKLDPKFYKGYLCRGCMKQTLGQDQDAIIDFDIVLKSNPKNATAYRNRGVAKRKLGAYEDALEDLNEAIRLKPDDGKAYNARGNIYKELQLHSKAESDYTKAKELKSKGEICFSNKDKTNESNTNAE